MFDEGRLFLVSDFCSSKVGLAVKGVPQRLQRTVRPLTASDAGAVTPQAGFGHWSVIGMATSGQRDAAFAHFGPTFVCGILLWGQRRCKG